MEPEWNNCFGKTLLTLTPDIHSVIFPILWYISQWQQCGWNLTRWCMVLHEHILSCDVGLVFLPCYYLQLGWFWVAAWLLLSHRPGNPAASPIWLPLWVWSVHPFTLNCFWTVASAQIVHRKKGSPSAVFPQVLNKKIPQVLSTALCNVAHTLCLRAQKVEGTSLSMPS